MRNLFILRKFGRLISVALLGALCLTGTADAADGTDWVALRRAVVDLAVFYPGDHQPTKTYGFFVAGTEGVVTSHRMVKGAERITISTFGGETFEATSYVARDQSADLILLRTERQGDGLTTGSHLILDNQQAAFVLLPPSVTAPPYDVEPYRVRYLNTILAPGVGELIAAFGNISTGLPMTDSVGVVVGMMEHMRDGDSFTICAVPIRNLTQMLGRPDAGGRLIDLADEAQAPWLDPRLPAGAEVMGALFCRLRRFSEGLPYLSRAREDDPNMIEALLEWGRAYQIQNEHGEAESFYQEALKLDPSNPHAHFLLAINYFVQEMFEQAKTENEATLALDPNFAVAHMNLGVTNYALENSTKAKESLQTAIEIEPELAAAYYSLGLLYYQEGEVAQAQKLLAFLQSRKSGAASRLLQNMRATGH